jgi:hypothetical protein
MRLSKKRQVIESKLQNLLIGIATERQAVYKIDFYAAPRKHLFFIHDLRLEIAGRGVQFDYLLMNRAVEVFVLIYTTITYEKISIYTSPPGLIVTKIKEMEERQ